MLNQPISSPMMTTILGLLRRRLSLRRGADQRCGGQQRPDGEHPREPGHGLSHHLFPLVVERSQTPVVPTAATATPWPRPAVYREAPPTEDPAPVIASLCGFGKFGSRAQSSGAVPCGGGKSPGCEVKMARPFWFAPWATHVAFRQLVLEGCPDCPGTRTGGCIRPLSRRAGSAAGRCETAMTSSPFISDSDRRSTPPRSAVASRERDGDVRRSRRAVARMAGRCTIILIHDDQFRRQGWYSGLAAGPIMRDLHLSRSPTPRPT